MFAFTAYGQQITGKAHASNAIQKWIIMSVEDMWEDLGIIHQPNGECPICLGIDND